LTPFSTVRLPSSGYFRLTIFLRLSFRLKHLKTGCLSAKNELQIAIKVKAASPARTSPEAQVTVHLQLRLHILDLHNYLRVDIINRPEIFVEGLLHLFTVLLVKKGCLAGGGSTEADCLVAPDCVYL
jgi:hypothetical protein